VIDRASLWVKRPASPSRRRRVNRGAQLCVPTERKATLGGVALARGEEREGLVPGVEPGDRGCSSIVRSG
jgi:hypothetical protein